MDQRESSSLIESTEIIGIFLWSNQGFWLWESWNSGLTAEYAGQDVRYWYVWRCGRSVPIVQCYSCFQSTHNSRSIPIVHWYSYFLSTHNSTFLLFRLRQNSFVLKCVQQWFSALDTVVSQLQQVVAKYVQRVKEISFVPVFSYGRGLLRDDGGPNRFFFTFLFCDQALAIALLQEVKLIRSEVLCDTCGRFMTCCALPTTYTTFHTIFAPRRKHRLVTVPSSCLLPPRHVIQHPPW